MNLNNSDPIKLSKAKPKQLENPLAKKTIGGTIFTFIQIVVFLSWFYWVYQRYITWYQYYHDSDGSKKIIITPNTSNNNNISEPPLPPTLPDTSIVKVGIPLFIISIIIEMIVCKVLNEPEHYRAADTMASFSNGILQMLVEMWTTLAGEIFGYAMITAIPYRWIYDNLGFTKSLEGNWQGFVFMFFARDFGYYWFHRAAHRSAFMWAVHGVHHIPSSFSYHVNLSQGAIQRITSALFYAPLALFCPPELYVLIFPMEKIYGFFTHTQLVANCYLFDRIFVTPSSHRVHHAGAPSKYLDRNYGEMLSIWDRMFGTHQDEEEPVVFGHVHPFDKWDPVEAQLHVWKKIAEKASTVPSFVDKFLCYVMPPGWDPINGGEYPGIDTHPYEAVKYDSHLPQSLTLYVVAWFLPILVASIKLMTGWRGTPIDLLFYQFAYMVYSLSVIGKLNDRNPRSIFYEIVRLLLVPLMLYISNVTNLMSIAGSAILAVVSIFIIISNNHLFIKESETQRNERVWIKEKGREFTKKLLLLTKSKSR